jgi:hypothetical protein
MPRVEKRLTDLAELPAVLKEIASLLQYHTESGFTSEEANAYAQQLEDLEELLIPAWRERLKDAAGYVVEVLAVPELRGFIKIRIGHDGADPIVVFTESYAHFNSEMFDGSCNQYVYQRVLCYKEGLESGRIALSS